MPYAEFVESTEDTESKEVEAIRARPHSQDCLCHARWWSDNKVGSANRSSAKIAERSSLHELASATKSVSSRKLCKN